MASKILSCPIPATINPLQNNGFLLSIEKLPDMQYFCQEVNLPGMTLPPATVNSPFSTVFIPGDKITYDNLTVIFMINETLSNYDAICKWIIGMGFPESRDQYKQFIDNQPDPSGMRGSPPICPRSGRGTVRCSARCNSSHRARRTKVWDWPDAGFPETF